MIYGYARVSTSGQARDGYSLEVQEQMLSENGATEIFADKFTGTKAHRPQLDQLMAKLASGDTLVVCKLDRIARSTVHGTQLVTELLERGVRVNILNMGVMDNTPASKLMRTMFFAFAEYERDMIVERTTEGKEVARLNAGFREGRPRKTAPGFNEIFAKQKSGQLTVSQACEALEISRSTWYNLARSNAGAL